MKNKKLKPGILIFFLIACCLIFPAVNAQVSKDSLIAFYPFDGNANDASGNNNHGTVHGAQLTTDRFGNPNSAYYFDGEGKYISANSSPSLISPTNKLTMAGWAMVMGPSFRYYIVDKRINYNTASPFDSYVLLSANENQTQTWQAGLCSSDTGVTGTSILKQNVWTFVVGVLNGSKLDLYVDGIFEGSSSVTGNIYYSDFPLYIGAGGLIPEHYMNGKIDDVRLYNRSLTPEEILLLYNEPGVLKPLINGAQKVCTGDKGVSFIATNMDSIINYSWNYSGNGASISDNNSSFVSIDFANDASNGTLTVTGNKADGSKDIASLEITVKQTPVAIAGSNSPVCEGSPLALTAEPVSGGSYNWTGPSGFSSVNQNPVIYNTSDAEEGVYVLTFTANECESDPVSTNVTIQAIPPSIPTNNSPVCEGSQLLLYAQTVPEASYIWAGPAGFSSSEQNPVINNSSITNQGTYTLWVSVNGCQSSPSMTSTVVTSCEAGDLSVLKMVSKLEPKIAEIIVFTIVAANNGSTSATDVTVSDLLQNGYTYLSYNATKGSYDNLSGIWTIGTLDKNESQILNINVFVNTAGDYGNTAVIQSSIDELNLVNNSSYVETIPAYFNIPNSFSPNGDGTNDLFIIRGLEANSKLIIFNTEGKIVFESDNYQNDWDGRNNDGEILNSDTYWYVLKMPGIPLEFKNFVYLKN